MGGFVDYSEFVHSPCSFFCFLFLKTKISNFFINDKLKQTKKIYRNTFYSITPFPYTTLCTCKCNAESWKKVNKRSSLKKDESAFKVVYLLISLLNVRPYEGICICPQKLYIKGGFTIRKRRRHHTFYQCVISITLYLYSLYCPLIHECSPLIFFIKNHNPRSP